jgi:hypothetical protein
MSYICTVYLVQLFQGVVRASLFLTPPTAADQFVFLGPNATDAANRRSAQGADSADGVDWKIWLESYGSDEMSYRAFKKRFVDRLENVKDNDKQDEEEGGSKGHVVDDVEANVILDPNAADRGMHCPICLMDFVDGEGDGNRMDIDTDADIERVSGMFDYVMPILYFHLADHILDHCNPTTCFCGSIQSINSGVARGTPT